MSELNLEKLSTLLDKIEKEISVDKTTRKDILQQEASKMYAFNALGICLSKLGECDDHAYKEGLLRTKKYFEKVNQMK